MPNREAARVLPLQSAGIDGFDLRTGRGFPGDRKVNMGGNTSLRPNGVEGFFIYSKGKKGQPCLYIMEVFLK